VRRKSVALAIRQCVALGFIEVTHRGGRSVSQYKAPSRYRLTYIIGRSPSPQPTDEWKLINTKQEALVALAKAEMAGDRKRQLQNSSRKPGAKTSCWEGRDCPSLLNVPRGEIATPIRGAKTPLLSISRVGRGLPPVTAAPDGEREKERAADQKCSKLRVQKNRRAEKIGQNGVPTGH
jgi:hypothetical protein